MDLIHKVILDKGPSKIVVGQGPAYSMEPLAFKIMERLDINCVTSLPYPSCKVKQPGYKCSCQHVSWGSQGPGIEARNYNVGPLVDKVQDGLVVVHRFKV